MPYHVYRLKLQTREIIAHAHLPTIQAAVINARSFAKIMGDNEVILMARLEFGDFTHFPREPGEMVYYPHAPDTKWHYDLPSDLRAALPVFDMLVFAANLIRKFDNESIEALRDLVEARAETHPDVSATMWALIAAANGEEPGQESHVQNQNA